MDLWDSFWLRSVVTFVIICENSKLRTSLENYVTEKIRENTLDLLYLAVHNLDLTRKNTKKYLGEKNHENMMDMQFLE